MAPEVRKQWPDVAIAHPTECDSTCPKGEFDVVLLVNVTNVTILPSSKVSQYPTDSRQGLQPLLSMQAQCLFLNGPPGPPVRPSLPLNAVIMFIGAEVIRVGPIYVLVREIMLWLS